MKLIKQVEEERNIYYSLMLKAKEDNDIDLLNRCKGVVAALDWVRGNRNNTDEVIDFIHLKQSIIDELSPEDFYN